LSIHYHFTLNDSLLAEGQSIHNLLDAYALRLWGKRQLIFLLRTEKAML
jgi:hypothetical protein